MQEYSKSDLAWGEAKIDIELMLDITHKTMGALWNTIAQEHRKVMDALEKQDYLRAQSNAHTLHQDALYLAKSAEMLHVLEEAVKREDITVIRDENKITQEKE